VAGHADGAPHGGHREDLLVREVDEEEVGRVVDVRLDRRQELVVQVVRLLGAKDGVQDVQHEEVG
jgi:hypothetical protein